MIDFDARNVYYFFVIQIKVKDIISDKNCSF